MRANAHINIDRRKFFEVAIKSLLQTIQSETNDEWSWRCQCPLKEAPLPTNIDPTVHPPSLLVQTKPDATPACFPHQMTLLEGVSFKIFPHHHCELWSAATQNDPHPNCALPVSATQVTPIIPYMRTKLRRDLKQCSVAVAICCLTLSLLALALFYTYTRVWCAVLEEKLALVAPVLHTEH